MFGNQQSDRLSKYWHIFFLFICVLIIQAQKSIQVKPSKPSNKNLVRKADTTIKTIKIVNADVARYDKNYSDANSVELLSAHQLQSTNQEFRLRCALRRSILPRQLTLAPVTILSFSWRAVLVYA